MKKNLQAVIFSLSAIFLIAGNVLAQVAATITVGGGTNTYSPSSGITVNPGDSIAFVWGGGFHTTASSNGGWVSTPATFNQSSAGTVKVKVTSTPGVYNYYCQVHNPGISPSGMYGTFTVSGSTSLSNSSSTYDLSAAPNPFSDQLSLNLNVGNKNLTNLKIYDLIGKEVANIDLSGKTGQHTYRVDASHLRSGIYFCTVYSDRGIVETMKLFKTNE
ncbi:MAG: T9SS type A sorting domain-containing protein [Cytophagaceae bacterium]